MQDTLRSLAGANHYDDGLMIVNCNGVENKGAYHEATQHRYKHEEIEEGLFNCYRNKIFDKPLLESVYIEQDTLGKWCLEKGVSLPSFWFSEGWKPFSNRYGERREENLLEAKGGASAESEAKLRPSQMDKPVCQAIARTLWNIYPQMTIADMCKHDAIRRYGNGAQYKGEHTLRDWLSEVAPPEVKGKRGRPKKAET